MLHDDLVADLLDDGQGSRIPADPDVQPQTARPVALWYTDEDVVDLLG